MTQRNENPSPFDPLGIMRTMQGASAEAWATVFAQMFNSEEYVRATSAMLDMYVATSEPFRKHIEKLLVDFVQSSGFNKALGKSFDVYLESTAPLRTAMIETMRTDSFIKVFTELLDQSLALSKPLREAMQQASMDALTQMMGSMTSTSPDTNKIMAMFDPFGFWRSMQQVGTEAFSKAGSGLPANFAVPEAYQQMMETTMGRVLQQLNMPTRTDINGIADRLEKIEKRLDAIEGKK